MWPGSRQMGRLSVVWEAKSISVTQTCPTSSPEKSLMPFMDHSRAVIGHPWATCTVKNSAATPSPEGDGDCSGDLEVGRRKIGGSRGSIGLQMDTSFDVLCESELDEPTHKIKYRGAEVKPQPSPFPSLTFLRAQGANYAPRMGGEDPPNPPS